MIILLSNGLITRKECAHAAISALRCAYLRKDVRVVPVTANFTFPSPEALAEMCESLWKSNNSFSKNEMKSIKWNVLNNRINSLSTNL